MFSASDGSTTRSASRIRPCRASGSSQPVKAIRSASPAPAASPAQRATSPLPAMVQVHPGSPASRASASISTGTPLRSPTSPASRIRTGPPAGFGSAGPGAKSGMPFGTMQIRSGATPARTANRSRDTGPRATTRLARRHRARNRRSWRVRARPPASGNWPWKWITTGAPKARAMRASAHLRTRLPPVAKLTWTTSGRQRAARTAKPAARAGSRAPSRRSPPPNRGRRRSAGRCPPPASAARPRAGSGRAGRCRPVPPVPSA